MGAFSLVALDLDGTTLNNDHQLADDTVHTLRKLNGLGVRIAIATGRSIKNLVGFVQQLDLPQEVFPVVGFNGSYGFTLAKEREAETIFGEPVPMDVTRLLLDFASRQGCVAQYYNGANGDVYAVPLNDEHKSLLKRYEQLVGSPQVLVQSYEEAIARTVPAKLVILTNQADELIAAAKSQLPVEQLTIIRGSPYPFFVEFLPAHVNKGAGLVRLCEHLGVPMSEVVAFGDGDNDREMLALAGRGCAVSNAKPLAREAANTVLEWTNEEAAVSRELERMLRDGEFKLSSE